jgi:hypothetical protein
MLLQELDGGQHYTVSQPDIMHACWLLLLLLLLDTGCTLQEDLGLPLVSMSSHDVVLLLLLLLLLG